MIWIILLSLLGMGIIITIIVILKVNKKSSCTSNCIDKKCDQDDGCGKPCKCPPSYICTPTGNCCLKTCLGNCGSDGCGGSCGTCSTDSICYNDNCCTSDCKGKVCGSDGCGGSCGTCQSGTCVDGKCICTPNCEGKVCGSDGCGGSCGTCQSGTCVDGECKVVSIDFCNLFPTDPSANILINMFGNFCNTCSGCNIENPVFDAGIIPSSGSLLCTSCTRANQSQNPTPGFPPNNTPIKLDKSISIINNKDGYLNSVIGPPFTPYCLSNADCRESGKICYPCASLEKYLSPGIGLCYLPPGPPSNICEI